MQKVDIPEDVLKIWEKYHLKENIRRHCIKVMEVALKISKHISGIDVDSVKIGALLHDIGWAVTDDPFKHFIKGAEILRREGFPEKIALIVERHFGAGLGSEEAKRLGLPNRDYLPISLEEKLVCHADNLVHGDKERGIEEYLNRLDKMGREQPEFRWLVERSKERAKRLSDEINFIISHKAR